MRRRKGKDTGIVVEEALEAVFEEAHYADFYRDIFPEGSFEEKGVYEEGRYNGIAVRIGKGGRAMRLTVTDDLDAIGDMAASDDFCIMSPISYAGKSRKSENARLLYALAIDLDGVETKRQWDFFMEQVERGHEMTRFVWGLPRPTYLVSSGTGVHIYYAFEEPVRLLPESARRLEALKRRLTWQAWTQGASSLHDNVQYESLFQGFRVVGTVTKDGRRCRAFKVGEKVTVEYLYRFTPEPPPELAWPPRPLPRPKGALRLEEARGKYPEWYQRRVVEKRPRKTWTCKRDLYDWWIRKMTDWKAGALQGHRYWCVMALAVYARKCGIPREELEADAYGLVPFLNTRGDEFTRRDVRAALEAYADSYVTYPIRAISERTGIPIERNKRNYQKQKDHLEEARAIRDIRQGRKGKKWTDGNGRPSKRRTVAEWRAGHPGGTKAACVRQTGLSKPTVYKWWDTDIE